MNNIIVQIKDCKKKELSQLKIFLKDNKIDFAIFSDVEGFSTLEINPNKTGIQSYHFLIDFLNKESWFYTSRNENEKILH